MNSKLLIEAINFAKNHSQIIDQVNERDNDDRLILQSISCKKTLYEGNDGYFLRIIFDYRVKNESNTNEPDVFIDLEYDGKKFKALPQL
jgi:hypothetical protein